MDVLLLGSDFSTRSDRALRRAILLARQDDRELLIVHVLDDDQPQKLLDTQRRDATALLDELERTIAEDGISCRTDVRLGRPSEQLSEAAREADAAMMIIGPHRRSLIRDAFGAVTAERIARHCTVPLLIANGVPSEPYRRLLLPIDLEEASRRTAMAVRDLPIDRRADTTLLNVYDAEAREMLGRAMVTADEKRDYLADRAARAERELREFAETLGIDAACLVEESRGSIAADIERVAARAGADLIVLSRSNKGAIEKGLVGSVTKKLVRSGEFDVLVVP